MVIYVLLRYAMFFKVYTFEATDLIKLIYVLQKRQFVVGTSCLRLCIYLFPFTVKASPD